MVWKLVLNDSESFRVELGRDESLGVARGRMESQPANASNPKLRIQLKIQTTKFRPRKYFLLFVRFKV